MRLALGILFLWVGAALLWVASHGTEASTPWAVYRQIIDGLKEA